ncbi:hypothetical protein GGR52DRAFT_537276 [Hypoxylon sp. FL1284]|nr:hypothetical protein GGR52DRAFT_537276 [Hypoxylon sp. FL1284]
MKSIVLAAFLAALPAWAVEITNSNFDGIQTGQPFDITWSDAAGAVTLTLKNGSSDNLQTVGEITSGQTGESYTWTPDTSLTSGTYALEIDDGTDTNYSPQFDIAGASASASSSASVSSTASSTSVSSTASSTTMSSSTITSSASATTSTGSSSTGSSTSGSSTTSKSASSTSSTSSTSASETAVPNTNAAQTAAPFVAPMLLALGAALI